MQMIVNEHRMLFQLLKASTIWDNILMKLHNYVTSSTMLQPPKVSFLLISFI